MIILLGRRKRSTNPHEMTRSKEHTWGDWGVDFEWASGSFLAALKIFPTHCAKAVDDLFVVSNHRDFGKANSCRSGPGHPTSSSHALCPARAIHGCFQPVLAPARQLAPALAFRCYAGTRDSAQFANAERRAPARK